MPRMPVHWCDTDPSPRPPNGFRAVLAVPELVGSCRFRLGGHVRLVKGQSRKRMITRRDLGPNPLPHSTLRRESVRCGAALTWRDQPLVYEPIICTMPVPSMTSPTF